MGRKYELAEKAYFAWKLKLEVAKTTRERGPREQEDNVSTRRALKLHFSCSRSVHDLALFSEIIIIIIIIIIITVFGAPRYASALLQY